jgi:hypothetical protein
MLQSPGIFLCNSSVLATFGSDFIKLINTNKININITLPNAHTKINITLPNAHTKMNLLYD